MALRLRQLKSSRDQTSFLEGIAGYKYRYHLCDSSLEEVTIFSLTTSELSLIPSGRSRIFKVNSLECVCHEIYLFGWRRAYKEASIPGILGDV